VWFLNGKKYSSPVFRYLDWQVLSGSLCLAFCFLVVFFLILGKSVAAQIRK